MTVEQALKKAESEPQKDFHIMIDVRDVLDILTILRIYDDNSMRQAINEILNMNIDLPYQLNIINANGNVEKYRPIET